ncbi:RNA polymerase sigma-70 factor [Nakamurella leprariae]|uniref:RNA polymerase sigma-70 factor n=1 Tax=Nakamurella leprariae TaxID=2803911 RepID=A0A939C0C3_9ACTN|nr:RNA polymerase sigma-70 factor [Nakamurella leprariae]MBM9466017.1 RNA polymerase sigma-70 factor [Nakamurella leprariae]
MTATDPLGAFTAHRDLLFTVAYEITGSAADAEDVMQETWLRWSGVDHARIDQPRAYLARIATRQSLNRLRTRQRRREDYVGSWLPEPLLTAPDVASDVELTDSVSIAMMLVLETLSPDERVVFVMREVFAFDHEEIARALDRTPAAVRQIAHRARGHVQARRPRFAGSPETVTAATQRFMAAVGTGRLQPLLDVLAPDVALIGDGGGRRKLNLRTIVGSDKVARFLLAVAAEVGEVAVEPVLINGQVGAVVRIDGELDQAAVMDVHPDGRIAAIYLMRNPDKHAGLQRAHTLTR